jgi:hypothetical protein
VFFCQSCVVCATKRSENLYQNLKIMKTLVPCMDGILWCSSKDDVISKTTTKKQQEQRTILMMVMMMKTTNHQQSNQSTT